MMRTETCKNKGSVWASFFILTKDNGENLTQLNFKRKNVNTVKFSQFFNFHLIFDWSKIGLGRGVLFLLRERGLRTKGQHAGTLLWLSMLQIDHHTFLEGLHPLKTNWRKIFAFSDRVLMVTTSVANTNCTTTWCNGLHRPFPPLTQHLAEKQMSIIRQLYYIIFYLFLDVLKEIAFAVPSASHSCNKVSKHNESWSPQIYFFLVHVYIFWDLVFWFFGSFYN